MSGRGNPVRKLAPFRDESLTGRGWDINPLRNFISNGVNLKIWLVMAVFLLAMIGTSFAAERHVPSQYSTIQAAINAARYGDVVIVAPGTYYENINFNGKKITVTSVNPNDPDIVNSTIIDGNGNGSVVTFTSGEEPDAVIIGFTITGGTGTAGWNGYWGGGIYCDQASPTITRNVIVGNQCPMAGSGIDGRGGGIGCLNSRAIIDRNIIKGNEAFEGGGINAYHWPLGPVYHGDVTITNNLIYDNLADLGGGVCLWNGRLVSNTVVSNNGNWEGGNVNAYGFPQKGELLIVNNIICNGYARWHGGGLCWVDPEFVHYDYLAYNNVWGNAKGNYYNLANQTGVNGNISQEPLFVRPISHDYHLLPGSPCIDAGDTASYFGLEPEPDGGRINMGAYGNTPEATCKGGLVLQSYNRVSKTRVGRTIFDYEFTVTLNNNSDANVCNVWLELLDASDNVVIIDPEVSFAYIAAGESATSEDTFAIRVDRSVLIDATIISWRATFEMAETGSIGERIFTTNIILETVSGDITGDGNVNYEDLAILAEQWLGPPDVPSADIAPSPADGVVNFLDFAVLANNWGYEKLIKFYDFPLDVVPAWTQGCDWEFGQPTGGGGDYGNPDPTSGYTGLNVYGVNLNGDYGVDPDFCYLQTELLDCSGYHNVHLRFARWLNTDAPPWVASKIEASDDGVNWHYVVWEHTGSSPITDDSWQIMEYDISGIADGESTVCIRWSYQILKGGAWQCSGWNIDDIELWGSP